MLDSVRRNIQSDAPIGTTLSGGIDTSAITCLIKDLGKSKNFHTYSLKMGAYAQVSPLSLEGYLPQK